MQETNGPRSDRAANSRQLRVALIGLGKIGFRNDFGLPTGETITHYSTLAKFSEVSIIAGIDSNSDYGHDFTSGTNVRVYENVSELKDKVEMVVIAASTKDHLNLVKEVIDHLKPRIIVCEKPMGLNSEEAKEIASLAQLSSINLYIPYLRRYMPHIKEIADGIKSKQFGNIVEVSVEYGQGLLTNGSHFVNLVDFLIGGLGIEVSDISRNNASNPSWSSTTLENVKVKFQGSSALSRSGEIRIRCETGEYVISHGGIVTYFGLTDPVSGWLEHPSNLQITDWRLGMKDFYRHLLSNYMNGVNDANEDLDSAIRTQEIIAKALG